MSTLNSPFDEPGQHWDIHPDRARELREGHRPARYWDRPPGAETDAPPSGDAGTSVELELVNSVRERVIAWRRAG